MGGIKNLCSFFKIFQIYFLSLIQKIHLKPTNTISLQKYDHSAQKNSETTEHYETYITFPKNRFFRSVSSANFTKYTRIFF